MNVRGSFIVLLCTLVSQQIYGDGVAETNLQSLRYVEEEFPDDEPFNLFLERILDYQLHPHLRKKRNKFFTFIEPHEEEGAIVDQQVWSDLHVLNGLGKGDNYFVAHVGTPITEIGRTTHYRTLAQPITDISRITSRQAAIDTLVGNQQLFGNITQALRSIAHHETGFIASWGNDGFVRSSTRFYYNSLFEQLNESVTALEFKSVADTVQTGLNVVADGIGAVVLTGYAAHCLGILPAGIMSKEAARTYQGAPGPLFAYLSHAYEDTFFQASLSVLAASYCASMVKPDAEWARDRIFILRCVQEKLKATAHTVKALRTLASYLKTHNDLSAHLEGSKELIQLFQENTQDTEARDLLKLLEEFTHDSFIARPGKILRTFRLLHKRKDIFQIPYKAAGSLDAFCTCARLLSDSVQPGPSYCFVTFQQADRPHIELCDFWNPFIDKEKVVLNTLVVDKNIVITGPNAGGKSTIIKSVALNIMLAQAYGIAAARRMVLTPFAKILTSANIVDDISQGNSLFKAEVLRMQSIMRTIDQLPARDFCFTFIDEPFSGTSQDAGAAAAYSIGEYLNTCKNNICMISTHFSKLTDLEHTCDRFSNYCVKAEINEKGCVTYPFIIEPGISDQNVAHLLLQQEGLPV